jgi:Tfp pilus assembly protein PilN
VIVSNLASRPKLNTRPVWLVVACAGTIALILAAVNVRLYVVSNQAIIEQLARRDALQVRRDTLADELSEHASVLEKVPWAPFGARVRAVNAVLAEHQFSWTGLLDHLADVLPWQVRMVSVSPSPNDEGAMLSLTAVSKDREGFLELLDSMVEDPHFDDPTPRRENWPEGGRSVEYQFTMTVQYQPQGEVVQ